MGMRLREWGYKSGEEMSEGRYLNVVEMLF